MARWLWLIKKKNNNERFIRRYASVSLIKGMYEKNKKSNEFKESDLINLMILKDMYLLKSKCWEAVY